MVVNRRCSLRKWDSDRSALQTLHKVSSKAREQNYFQGGLTHSWVTYYEERIKSDRSCLNEWHAMDNLESRRPPSPDSVRTKPTEREETERIIRSTLKEIMMSVDLDEVTSKYIRSRLEEDLNMDLGEFKSFIDQEMLTILGQMDAPTEIFDHVYLGSEWNASNYEELQRNGVGHILNVTREIDNFFPGTFDYLNIRVYDDEKTDLLKYWDDTFKYISKARNKGSKVLVHCKMGVSRSASVVIAYAMKAYNWDFDKAMRHVKEKRTCIKPNTSFLNQLEMYQGILDAMKNKEKLQRSKSETNLKSPKNERVLVGSEPTPIVQINSLQTTMSGQDLRRLGSRPKSWSPDNVVESDLNDKSTPTFRSLENLNELKLNSCESLKCSKEKKSLLKDLARNVLLPCDNGESYSVSPNQIMHISDNRNSESEQIASVKERVNELESKKAEKKKLVLNLLPQFENSSDLDTSSKVNQVLTDTWDPGEKPIGTSNGIDCDLKSSASDEETVEKVPEVLLRTKTGDPFSNQLDRVFDREERKQQRVTMIPDESETCRECPSRQSSWSSYDSAVVLGFQGETREAPSRHSSWGSGDTRILPSRNSSWGSYDMRKSNDLIENSSSGIFPYDKEEIPWYPGTVKRTKQKLEENSGKQIDDRLKCSNETLQEFPVCNTEGTVEAFNPILVKNSSSKINISSAINKRKEVETTRLSVSAPENSTLEFVLQEGSLSKSASNITSPQCSSVKHHKTYLKSLKEDLNRKEELETNSGLVKNLKKEFERVNQINLNLNNSGSEEDKKNKVNSLPSSPVTPLDKTDPEERNFKELIGKFENKEVTLRQKLKPYKNARYSYCEVAVEKNLKSPLISNYNREKSERPPMAPGKNAAPNVVATVIAAAKKQQQFGKTHPLARLNIKSKHNNPVSVYNTM